MTTPFLTAPAYAGDTPEAHVQRVHRLLCKLGLATDSPTALAEARYGVRLAQVAARECAARRRVRGLSA